MFRCWKFSNTQSILFLKAILFLISSTLAKSKSNSSPYNILAQYLSKTIITEEDYSIPQIQSALSALSKSQSTLKSIDGASHEFYQRSHSNTLNGSSGRVERSAGRVGCCADSLFGCELLDWMDSSYLVGVDNSEDQFVTEEIDDQLGLDNGTLDLHDRQIVLNTTIDEPIPIKIVVLYEDDYAGGAGMNHGGIDGLASPLSSREKRGRYLILLKDAYENDLEKTLECLDSKSDFFELNIGLVSGEVASINKKLWNAARKVLEACESCWDTANSGDNTTGDTESLSQETNDENDGGHDGGNDAQCQESTWNEGKKPLKEVNPDTLPALHFVGRSLAGGVASIAAGIVDGSLPMYTPNTRKRKSGSRKHRSQKSSNDSSRNSRHGKSDEIVGADARKSKLSQVTKALDGFGSGRSSALALGAPPSISANIKAAFITSVIVGDDIICRASKDTLDRLRERAKKRLESGVITKQVGWLTDTLSLTLSNLQSHAHGSEGEEARLSIPGKVYLVRPRSIGGGVSSIHEIGRGRDAMRAAVLWQLNDILLSSSLWKHHSLKSYIQALDKVQLRQIKGEEIENKAEYA